MSPLNFLDWLASKSKLKSSTARPSTVKTPPVRGVDVEGDVIKYFQSSQEQYQDESFHQDNHLYKDQNHLQEEMDMAESSVQVR